MSCSECKHFRPEYGSHEGFCHRYPPALVSSNPSVRRPDSLDWAFPKISSHNYCGEFLAVDGPREAS